MKRSRNRPMAGFTIIEIMIVLVIAGFILVIVFLAVPQLQRNYRNYRRKQAIAFIITEMQNYETLYGHAPLPRVGGTPDPAFLAELNNEGPTKGFRIRYIDSSGSHTYPYDSPPVNQHLDELNIEPAHWCNTNSGLGPGSPNYPLQTSGSNDTDYTQYVSWTLLEQGPVFCLDNHQ